MATRTAYPGSEAAGDILTAANFNRLPGGWIGYSAATSDQATITTVTDLTNLTVTPTIGTNRKISVTAEVLLTRTVADGITSVYLTDVTAGVIIQSKFIVPANTGWVPVHLTAIVAPAAGARQYKLSLERTSGTGSVASTASATDPAYILVTDIGSAS